MAATRMTRTDPTATCEDVMKAVARTRAAIAQDTAVTAQSLMAQLAEDRDFARTTSNATAACRASELMGKLAGLMVERKDVRAAHALTVEVVSFADA